MGKAKKEVDVNLPDYPQPPGQVQPWLLFSSMVSFIPNFTKNLGEGNR